MHVQLLSVELSAGDVAPDAHEFWFQVTHQEPTGQLVQVPPLAQWYPATQIHADEAVLPAAESLLLEH